MWWMGIWVVAAHYVRGWGSVNSSGACDTEVVEQHRPEASPASDGGVRCLELPVNGTICTACQVVTPPLLAGLGPSVRLRSDGSTFSTTSAAVQLPLPSHFHVAHP